MLTKDVVSSEQPDPEKDIPLRFSSKLRMNSSILTKTLEACN